MADNGGFSREKRYDKPKREQTKREIHRLVLEQGLSVNEIVMKLGIPKRTIERYLHEIYEQDALTLLRPTISDITESALIYRDRLTIQRRQVLELANDKSIDAEARLQAHQLANQMDRSVHYLSYSIPMTIADNMRVDIGELRNFVQIKGLNVQLLKRAAPPTSIEERQEQQKHEALENRSY